MTDLLCIDCSAPLASAVAYLDHYVLCDCGLPYATQLLDAADRGLWERARTERLFRRHGNAITMTTPLEAIREWA